MQKFSCNLMRYWFGPATKKYVITNFIIHKWSVISHILNEYITKTNVEKNIYFPLFKHPQY